jgi:hypothetical protein
MIEIGSWSTWASPLEWTTGTLIAVWAVGHVLGAVLTPRLPPWFGGRQAQLTAFAAQIVRRRLP